MRISGGIAKGRRTATKKQLSKTLKARRLRPTSSKVREALFDILRGRIDNAVFLDLYAGTGTVGLEAISRGAKKTVFVEQNSFRVREIKKIITELGFHDKAEIVRDKVYDFICRYSGEIADIVFIDPPYQSNELDIILPLLGKRGLLGENGVVIVEHFSKKRMPENAGSLIKSRIYRYGDTLLTVYRKAE